MSCQRNEDKGSGVLEHKEMEAKQQIDDLRSKYDKLQQLNNRAREGLEKCKTNYKEKMDKEKEINKKLQQKLQAQRQAHVRATSELQAQAHNLLLELNLDLKNKLLEASERERPDRTAAGSKLQLHQEETSSSDCRAEDDQQRDVTRDAKI